MPEEKTSEQIQESIIKDQLGRMFDGLQVDLTSFQNTVGAVGQILKDPRFEERNIGLDSDKIVAELNKASAITDKDKFVNTVFEVLRPVNEFKLKNPEIYEDVQAEYWTKAGGFTLLNERLSYGADDGVAHFHLAESRMVKHKLGEIFIDGLQKLAKVVKDDESIELITGTSHLLAREKFKQMLANEGFKLEELSEEEKQKYFAGDDREIWKASMTREAFLKRFGE